jgi:hypothetical protein
MRIVAPCAVIGPALAFVRDIIPARSPLPILSSIILETGDGRVNFRPTDLDADLRAAVPVDPTPRCRCRVWRMPPLTTSSPPRPALLVLRYRSRN